MLRKSKVVAKVKVFGALVENDITFASDANEPSVDDWGTCGVARGKCAFGILCHGVLRARWS